MESKVIILLAFATLAQCTDDYVANLTVTYGLSDEAVLILQEIVGYQENSKSTGIEATNVIFDTFTTLAAELVVGSEDSLDSSVFCEAVSKARSAHDLVYDSILLATESSCSDDVETSRTETYDIIDAIASTLSSALTLATCGSNFSEKLETIESYKTTVDEYFQNLTAIEYGALTTSLSTTDSKLLNVLETALNASLLSNTYLTNAIFNAIKIIGAATSDTYTYSSALTCKLEEYQEKAWIAHRDDTENKFTAIRTVFINANLNQSGIAECVFQSQRTDIMSLRAYQDGNVVLFKNKILNSLEDLNLGIDYDGSTYYEQDTIDLTEIILQFDEGDHIILNNSLFMHPENYTQIYATRDNIHDLNVEGDVAMNDAYHVAKNKSVLISEALELIETLRHAAVDPAPAYTELFFSLIRGNTTFDETTIAQLTDLQTLTIYGAREATNTFLDAVIILANATRAGVADSDDIAAVKELLLGAYAGLEAFSQPIAAAGLLVCNYLIAN